MNKTQIFLVLYTFLIFLGGSWAMLWNPSRMIQHGCLLLGALIWVWPLTWDDTDL